MALGVHHIQNSQHPCEKVFPITPWHQQDPGATFSMDEPHGM